MIKFKDILLEMPNLKLVGNKGYTQDSNIEMKRLSDAEVDENIIFYVEKEGNFFFAKGYFMVWFVNSPDQAQKMSSQEHDVLFFPPKISFTSSPITDIWKKNKNLKGVENILGAAQGWVNHEKNEVYVNMISVRSKWQKNNVSTFIMNSIKKQWPGYNFKVSKTTDDGTKFFNKYDKSNEIERDTRDYSPN